MESLRRLYLVGLLMAVSGCLHSGAKAGPATSAPSFRAHVYGSGRPVVFIPDLEAPGEIWDSTVAHLGGAVEAHVIDIAGFAGNPATEGPLVPRLRDELARYLRQHARGAVVVGHMFGAELAYWLAMTEPDLLCAFGKHA